MVTDAVEPLVHAKTALNTLLTPVRAHCACPGKGQRQAQPVAGAAAVAYTAQARALQAAPTQAASTVAGANMQYFDPGVVT